MMLNTDKISGWMGAPPHHWKLSEIQQIKQIHRCYRNAYSNTNNLRDEVEIIDDEKPQGIELNGKKLNVKINHHKKPGEEYAEGDEIEKEAKKDEEDFLPRDSALRSKDGDKKAPANPVFKDYEGFVNSCSFDFWRSHFENQNNDKFLAETAQTIVANICNAQARNEMRVHNGHIPLRKKREHITPLALVLHDIKMWATHDLRTANVNNEDTYQDLRCRIKYLESLAHKEVWGDSAVVFGAGMRAVAHDKLFRLFLTAREALERAEEYAYRGYSRRSSREKLHKIGNLLKDVVLNEMRILSGRMTLEQKMIDPKTARLQPTDLLNSIENQGFVDFKNPVNVLMYKLCQNPLVKAALTAEYDKPEVIDTIEHIGTWNQQNLFCRRGKDEELVGEPDFRMDQRREVKIMPEVYGPTAADLKRRIRDVDPKAPVPDSPKKVIARMKAAYGTEEDAARVIKLVMKNAAAIQELIPSIYAMHQLWILAGDGGDFTVYDTMRENVIRVMSDTMERVITVQKSGLSLMREIQRLAELKEKNMKEEALRNRKMKYKPAWVMNHKFIGNELFDHCQNTYKNSLARLAEVAQDARDYSLTTDQLSDKVKDAQKVLDALTGFHGRTDAPTPIIETVAKGEAPVRTKKDDWLHSEEENFGGFGNNNAFGDQYSSHFGDDNESFNVGAAKYDDDDDSAY